MAYPLNTSFEDAGTNQGEADLWTVETQSDQVSIATFEDETTTWNPFEDFEEGWRRPFLVHQTPDLKSVVTAADATNLASLYILSNELLTKYSQHIDFAQNIRGTGDSVSAPDGVTGKQTLVCDEEKFDATDASESRLITISKMVDPYNNGIFTITDYVDVNTIKYVNAAGSAETYAFEWELEVVGPHLISDIINRVYLAGSVINLDTAIAALIILKAWYNEHIDYWPQVHRKWDNQTIVTAPSIGITLESEAITLANDIKAMFNDHLNMQGYGDTTSDAVFEIPDNAEYAIFLPDDTVEWENFERFWAINDLYAIEDQVWMVTVDDEGVGWPTGHIQFLDVFEYIGSALGANESFDTDWLLPGSDTEMPNELFKDRYYDTVAEEWRFRDPHFTHGITEDFSSGWKDNDVGTDRYWDSPNSEWAFLAMGSLLYAGIDPYTFATYNLATGASTIADALVMPKYSGDFYVEVTEALDDTEDQGIGVSYYDNTDTTQYFVFWFDAGTASVGAKTRITSGDGDPSSNRDPVHNRLVAGILGVNTLVRERTEPVGAVAVKGWEQTYEDFSTNWVLSLDD